jgi:hypothetical protein
VRRPNARPFQIKHKNRHQKVLGDVNTFGVMMVAAGDADGMVSGAIHTTAATIRPAMQVWLVLCFVLCCLVLHRAAYLLFLSGIARVPSLNQTKT